MSFSFEVIAVGIALGIYLSNLLAYYLGSE